VGGTNMPKQILDGGRHLKIGKLLYRYNGLTDFDEICSADAYWPSRHYRAKTFKL